MSGELPEELSGIEGELFGDEEGEEPSEGEPEEVEPEERERVILFRLGGQTYAAPVMQVTQVVETTSRTRVPRTSEAVDGIMDLRGEITAIINPWVHLTIPDPPNEWNDQLVAVFTPQEDEQPIGIRIDQILGVEQFSESQITHDVGPDAEGPNTANPLVEGIIAREDGDGDTERIAILDPRKIVDASRQQPHASI